jgi:hypothetical protein
MSPKGFFWWVSDYFKSLFGPLVTSNSVQGSHSVSTYGICVCASVNEHFREHRMCTPDSTEYRRSRVLNGMFLMFFFWEEWKNNQENRFWHITDTITRQGSIPFVTSLTWYPTSVCTWVCRTMWDHRNFFCFEPESSSFVLLVFWFFDDLILFSSFQNKKQDTKQTRDNFFFVSRMELFPCFYSYPMNILSVSLIEWPPSIRSRVHFLERQNKSLPHSGHVPSFEQRAFNLDTTMDQGSTKLSFKKLGFSFLLFLVWAVNLVRVFKVPWNKNFLFWHYWLE